MKTLRRIFISLTVVFLSLCNVYGNEKLVYKYRFAPHEGFINKTEKEFRSEVCLNGLWDFQPVDLPSGYIQGKGIAPELSMPRENAWSDVSIKIPSPWNINSFANNGLEGPDHRNFPSYPTAWDNVRMAWMRKFVTIPDEWTDKQILLHFEAVAGFAEVYVNKRKVGENFDLFLPFDVDITEYVEPGQRVELLVGVRSQSLFEDNSTIGRRIIPAGSMWGYHISGIWQDVYLLGMPRISIEDVFVKPMVSKNTLNFDVTIRNNTVKNVKVQIDGVIKKWINKAGIDVNNAPVPHWELGNSVLHTSGNKIEIPAKSSNIMSVSVPVNGELEYWTPEFPNLYAVLFSVKQNKDILDVKYERFGWREWTLVGDKQCLNGKPYQLKGDSWHFMGIPQMTRRYAWAWFTAVKDMNGNAVRLHAQVYPRFYLDVADEMGICVLDETANWASDGSPKLDSDLFWEYSKEHLRRLVLRDRNHASVFGWSISNENKPVILHVYNRPDLIKPQEKAWEEWKNIVKCNDPTRPWISSDGEDDGNGILPVTVGHYGDEHSMKNWMAIGKPWGIGEHSMAYYGTPEQVSKYNGERAYESQQGRMEGLANECYNLLVAQRMNGASYSTVFNMVWYGLKPLPLGKRDLTLKPDVETDGVFLGDYVEGIPGVQPERVGPYSSTLNPGYDPSLPLYEPWPMFDAMRAANAGDSPAWSEYKSVKKYVISHNEHSLNSSAYDQVCFVGGERSIVKDIFISQGVELVGNITKPKSAIYIIDGAYSLSIDEIKKIKRNISKGADIWIWGIVPATATVFNEILPKPIEMDSLNRSSFITVNKSLMNGLGNSDFYFCELQNADASSYTLKGEFVREGDVLLNACKTDWRKWNKRPEELKTASVLRSEYECVVALPVFVEYKDGESVYYVNTVNNFTSSEKGFKTLSKMLKNMGIECKAKVVNADERFFLRDEKLELPLASNTKMVNDGAKCLLDIYVFSPRPLDNLLIEPDMPKLSLVVNALNSRLMVNGKELKTNLINNSQNEFKELPLTQGWNKLVIELDVKDKGRFGGYFYCENRQDFMSQIKASFTDLNN